MVNKVLLRKFRQLFPLIFSLIPPIFVNFVRKRANLSMEVASYKEAVQLSDGYENHQLIEMIVQKAINFANNIVDTRNVEPHLFRTFVAISAGFRGDMLRVLDFGGSAGIHYFLVRAVLSPNIKLDWRIVETESLVKRCKESSLNVSELSFFSSITDAISNDQFDLVYSSDALQYCPDPYKFLDALCKVKSNNFMFSRLPISFSGTKFLIQKTTLSGHGIGPILPGFDVKDRILNVPVTILNNNDVLDYFNQIGRVELHFSEGSAVYTTSKDTFDYYGYLVRRNT